MILMGISVSFYRENIIVTLGTHAIQASEKLGIISLEEASQ